MPSSMHGWKSILGRLVYQVKTANNACEYTHTGVAKLIRSVGTPADFVRRLGFIINCTVMKYLGLFNFCYLFCQEKIHSSRKVAVYNNRS